MGFLNVTIGHIYMIYRIMDMFPNYCRVGIGRQLGSNRVPFFSFVLTKGKTKQKIHQPHHPKFLYLKLHTH